MRYLAVPVQGAGPMIGGSWWRHPTRPGGIRAGRAAAVDAADRARSSWWGPGWSGYWLAGTSLRPVQGIMDEVEAISDGRSLHRRLAVPLSGDEMARLALTVNGMLARLEQSFGSLHRFTADASHELKTPLMVLRAGVERALVHPGIPPEILQSLDETLAQINQMTEMVESLLTLARADEGRAPLAVEECDLRELVADVAETAGMLGEGVGVTEVHSRARRAGAARGGPPPDPGDAAQHGDQRDQVHAAGRHGGAQPGAGRGGRHLLGSGYRHRHRPGRPAPHLRALLAGRSRPLAHRRAAGVGLGLAITKWIAEAHGGIDHGAEPAGAGVGLTVRLPKVQPPGDGAPSSLPKAIPRVT